MIRWFEEIDKEDFDNVGGKGYNLSKIYNHGVSVPNGYIITTSGYDTYIKENNLESKIEELLKTENTNSEKSKNIKELFQMELIPEDLKQQILRAFNKIESGRVAVRSSSTVEDLPGMSFAGQYSSFLNVRADDLIEKVLFCWQSLWNDRAIQYRNNNNVSNDFSHGVVIQEMITAKLSGVAFSSNPINGIRNEILINASYGLGEAIVSGEVNPDQYVINKKTGEIVEEIISSKEILCKYAQSGVEYVPVNELMKLKRCLNKKHLELILDASCSIEEYFGKPQDIEFAIDDGDEIFILQSRDITTLFPIDGLEQDGKLRGYLSAGTVLLGTREPFTPLGFDMMSQMFPTIINVMTMQKKPLDNSFVKYNACRLYVDITYLMSSKFVSKQFAKAFSGNDLPLKDVMLNVIEEHGNIFRKQGIKFKIPWGGLKYSISMITSMRKIMKIPNESRYDAMIQIGEEVYQKWLDKSKELITLGDKVDFIDKCMTEAFVLSQKQALYCTEMNNITKIKKTIEKMYGDRFNVEYLIHSLPRCVSQELTIKMNQAAKFFYKNNIEPTENHSRIRDILDRFGHRSNIELDVGTLRWNEDPSYIINQIKSYMENQMYERNLKAIKDKKKRAEALVEEIYQTVKADKGEKKAEKLKKQMTDYRIAAGMREYPKYDIVRIMSIARKVMLDVGQAFVEEGKLNQREDIFFLFKRDILNEQDLLSKVKVNKANYNKEMKRRRIPRIVLNTGETYYSSRKTDIEGNIIQGMPLSPGVYEGTIRVVIDPLKSSLEEGDIMVTESTNPAWTPLFAIAKGLIMEYGGPVSHGGIVAREYGIPAVVGISDASRLLKDGQKVRINGETGTIEILEQLL
jgi:pyruvate,water dikinase